MRSFALGLLLFCFPFFSFQAQEDEDVEKYSIIDFDILDTANHHFQITISSQDGAELCSLLKGTTDREMKIRIGGIDTEVFRSTVRRRNDDNTYKAIISSYESIPTSIKNKVTLFIQEDGKRKFLDDFEFSYSGKSKNDEQPIIDRLKPSGGAAGDTLVILGKNFGNDIDKIKIYLYDISQNHIPMLDDDGYVFHIDESNYIQNDCDMEIPENDSTPFEYKREMGSIVPLSLSSLENGLQEVRFSVPSELRLKAEEDLIRVKIKMRMYVNGRGSDMKTITILRDDWNFKVLSFTLLVSLLGWVIVALLLKRWDFFQFILLDKTTNTYSLSKFQALAWTGILVASYFYVSLCSGLILRTGEIPYFNPSLLALMGISYSGMLSASFLGKKNPENSRRENPPQFRDLIVSNGEVDMGKVQLFVFTLVTIIVYIYNLYLSNALNGLPDIPPTLHGLLMTSQTGYITGKILKNKIAINKVVPSKVTVQKGHTFEIEMIGSGFTPGTKVMLEDSSSRPVTANIENNTNMYCSLPMDVTPGIKNLMVIPPEGSSIIIDRAFELIQKEPEPGDSEVTVAEQEFLQRSLEEANSEDQESSESEDLSTKDSNKKSSRKKPKPKG